MNTQLLDTLKEKWTKKSTKIACASVGTAAVLGVVGALIACNVPLTKQVVAEDGTVTTVQTQQKESHGILDLFHTPTESADAAHGTTTEITPPQTNADGSTPINTPTAAPGTPQAAVSGDTTNNPAATNAQVQTSGNTPTPAPADASAPAPAAAEPSPAAAEQSAEPAEESPAPATPEQKWVKPVWVVDQAEVKAIPPKYNIIHGDMCSDGKFIPHAPGDLKEVRDYMITHKVGSGTWTKRELIDPGRPYSPEKGHWEDPTTGKRLSPTYERSH